MIKELEKYLLNAEMEKSFFEKRELFLWSAVTDQTSERLVKQIFYLAEKDAKKPITLFINSPGGVISAGMAIFDVMQKVKCPIATTCTGIAASMASVLLAAGAKGKRSCWPSSKVMIHQPLISGQIIAPAIDVKIQADELSQTKKSLNKLLAKLTGQKLEKIEKDTDRDYYLLAEDAKAYGLVDSVG